MEIGELAVKVADVDSRSKSNTHRLDNLEKRQDDLEKLVSSVALMAQELEHIKDDVAEVKDSVKSIMDKPGKRWDAVVEKVIMLVVAAVVVFALAHIGLG